MIRSVDRCFEEVQKIEIFLQASMSISKKSKEILHAHAIRGTVEKKTSKHPFQNSTL